MVSINHTETELTGKSSNFVSRLRDSAKRIRSHFQIRFLWRKEPTKRKVKKWQLFGTNEKNHKTRDLNIICKLAALNHESRFIKEENMSQDEEYH